MGGILQVFLVAQTLAQLIAAAAWMRRCEGRTATMRTGAAGLMLLTPWVVWVAEYGIGPASKTPARLTAPKVAQLLLRTVSADGMSTVAAAFLVAVALAGTLALLRDRGRRDDAVMLICWAIAGPLALTGYAVINPVVLVPRYCLASLPAWAALSAAGAISLAGRGEVPVPGASRPGRRRHLAGAVACVAVAAAAVSQLPSQIAVRSATGHGEDIRPVAALALSPRWAGVAVLPASRVTALELASYAPRLDPRIVGWHLTPDTEIFPTRAAAALHQAALDNRPMLIIVRPLFIGSHKITIAQARRTTDALLPRQLTQDGYRTGPVLLRRGSWLVTVLARHSA